MKIIHIADIHWRGMSRHDEYRESFERFFKQAQDLNPDVIYVGGDIVHSKTQGISPELIDVLSWWFTSLAEVAPTHIILGNHDGLILNQDRQDAISPIISALDNPRLHLYKKSGTYPTGIPGYNWCVFSCFDEEGWKSVKPVQGDINIALFHGAVWGSKTDSDWSIEGEILTEFFDDYDFTLLGDIHTCQFLDDKKTMAYPGSTIQQNYGEAVGKGFLFWEIENKQSFTSTFYEIKHSRPFITVDWKDSAKETLFQVEDIPPGARYRIRSDSSIPQADIVHLHSVLKHEKKSHEVVFKIDESIDSSTINLGKDSIFKENLRDLNTHIGLMRKFYKDSDISKKDWGQLEDLIKKYFSHISRFNESPRNIKWSIKNLKFDNTFAYGKNNQIDFSTMSGISGIFGPNRCGKSSIVGTLMYGLFNTTDRGPIKNLHIINTRKGHCKTEIDLNINGKNYRAERQSVKHESRQGKVNAITHLNFYEIDGNGNVIRDLTEEQRRETEKVLRKKVGTAEDFLMTSLSSQGGMNSFIKERATQRKLILTNFLDLNIFDQMMTVAKEEISDIRSQMKSVPDRDWDVAVYDIRRRIKNLQAKLRRFDTLINTKRLAANKIQLEIASFENSDVITSSDLTRQGSLIDSLSKNIKHQRLEIKNRKDQELEQIEKLQKILNIKNQFPIDQLKERLESQHQIEKSLIKIRSEHEREITILVNQETSIKKLKEVPCGDLFPACKFIKDSHENRKRVSAQKIKAEEMLDQVEASQSALSVLKSENLQEKLEKYNHLLQEESEINLKNIQLRSQTREAESTLLGIITQLQSAKKMLEEMKKNYQGDDRDESLNLIKEKLFDYHNEINSLDAQRISLAQNIGKLKSDRKTIKEERKKYQFLKDQWTSHNLFLQAVSKKGIPLQIIMSYLPAINSEIAKILQNTVGFTVELEADVNSNAMDIYINYGDSRRVIELASGMEKMISSLAIRVALINISSLPKTDLLIIDEGFGSLDEMNIESCNRLLDSLKQWFKNILIISHVDAVKDVVDNVIDITKKGKDSRVYVGKQKK
jgi:DNA repair exonuclease SbcCD ATPase subunit/DNA repair exonuclease SbcCD nuclease subunit